GRGSTRNTGSPPDSTARPLPPRAGSAPTTRPRSSAFARATRRRAPTTMTGSPSSSRATPGTCGRRSRNGRGCALARPASRVDPGSDRGQPLVGGHETVAVARRVGFACPRLVDHSRPRLGDKAGVGELGGEPRKPAVEPADLPLEPCLLAREIDDLAQWQDQGRAADDDRYAARGRLDGGLDALEPGQAQYVDFMGLQHQ